jgi:hypothetical protein
MVPLRPCLACAPPKGRAVVLAFVLCPLIAGCTAPSSSTHTSANDVRLAVAQTGSLVAHPRPSREEEDAIIARAIAEHEMRRP